MKKFLVSVSSVATYLLLAPSAFAQVSVNACPNGTQFGGLCFQASDLGSIVGGAINFAFVLAGLVALGYLIYGGIKWVISEGDKSNVESARNHIVASIIGLIIIFMSYLIMNIVLNFFAGVNLMDLKLPQLQGACDLNNPGVIKTSTGKACCPAAKITPVPAGSVPGTLATCGI